MKSLFLGVEYFNGMEIYLNQSIFLAHPTNHDISIKKNA